MLNNNNPPSRSKHEQSGAVSEKPAELFFGIQARFDLGKLKHDGNLIFYIKNSKDSYNIGISPNECVPVHLACLKDTCV